MHHVAGVEELSDGGVDVLLRLVHGVGCALGALGLVLVVKVQVFASIGTVVVEPVVPTFPVFMGEDLNRL